MAKKMKIVVVDPQLMAFGHHVGFNKHVLRLLESVAEQLVFLDVDGLMRRAWSGGAVEFVDITQSHIGGISKEPLSPADFSSAQRSEYAQASLWKSIEFLHPDIVILASEGNNRTPLYGTIPEDKPYKLLVIVHVIWSMLNSMQSSPALLSALRRKVDACFVLEPFLTDSLSRFDVTTLWFPLRSYDDCSTLSSAAEAKGVVGDRPLRIGTVGVINERRNHVFLIESLSQRGCLPLHYLVAGQLMPSVENEVRNAVRQFECVGGRQIEVRFEHLSDDDFERMISGLDLGLLAYDDQRVLQASGAVYSYAELGVPLMVPANELFNNYQDLYPGLFFTYPPLEAAGLMGAIKSAGDSLNSTEAIEAFSNARSSFIKKNALSSHRQYMNALLRRVLEGTGSSRSVFSIGNSLFREGRFTEATWYYGASASLSKTFYPCYENMSLALERSGNCVAGAYCRSKAIGLNDKIRDCGDFSLKEGGLLEILVYPVFESTQELSDFLARFYWHFYSIVSFIGRIHVFFKPLNNKVFEVPPSLSSVVVQLASFFEKRLCFHGPSDFGTGDWSNVSMTLLWRYDTPERRSHPFSSEQAYLYKRPIWRVDEKRERFATSFYLKAVSSLIDVELLRAKSRRVFGELRRKFTSDTLAVFGTGPSLSDAMDVSFAGVDAIAANSMVKNIELLDHIQPKLIVCADPIFHAGASTYAEEFRQHLRFAMKRYACPVAVPERDFHIYSRYFENDCVDLIAIPLETGEVPNYKMNDNFYATTTGNVLTLFLLQVGFSFCDTVDIYGCDGRPVGENSYFWGHDKSAQFNEKMDDIKLAHPGFFDISYDDYYSEHCATLEVWLSHAESMGKVARSRTFSHIPALQRREKQIA